MQYCGVARASLGSPFQLLPRIAIENRSADYPRAVSERVIGRDFTSINCQPQRSRADSEVIGGIGQADPKLMFVGLVTGDAIMASQKRDSLPRPTITASREVTVPVQNAGDDVSR